MLDSPDAWGTFLERLETVYTTMDREYATAAGRYGFSCDGCKDNCCRSLFEHHTLLEYLYLHRGYRTLDGGQQAEIRALAAETRSVQSAAIRAAKTVRRMCPLNVENLCILYPYRPMICRLHGIPYVLHRPGRDAVQGSGCLTFGKRHSGTEYAAFDRTPLYASMAQLERSLRQAVGFRDRINMTIAEMLVS